MARNKKLKEASGLIASSPGPAKAEPNFIELLYRELDKLRGNASIDSLTYSRARDLVPLLRTSIFNIYGRQDRGLERALMFVLKQARRRTIY